MKNCFISMTVLIISCGNRMSVINLDTFKQTLFENSARLKDCRNRMRFTDLRGIRTVCF